jgi:large repetitive protein
VIALSSLGTVHPGFRIKGIDYGDYAGQTVANAGDVNGDGLADVVISARLADAGGLSNAGESYVVFGKTSSTLVSLSALSAGGFRIDGAAAGDLSGRDVSGAGDVNGDGLSDLIIGAYAVNSGTGRAYVVFGKTDGSTVSLSALGDQGFKIDAATSGDRLGGRVSGVGDLNSDGFADIIVSARLAGNLSQGECVVVFGKSDTTPVNVGALGTGGFRILGDQPFDDLGFGLSRAGDVNADGLEDFFLGSAVADRGGLSNVGVAYVVFGKSGAADVALSALGDWGFRIDGDRANHFIGMRIGGAGDVNGDGMSDVLVGFEDGTTNGFASGETYLILGKTSTEPVSVSNLSLGGFQINGEAVYDLFGTAVAGAGDINGDGLADMIVGARYADPAGVSRAGKAYVIFGRTGLESINLSNPGFGGFSMGGIDVRDMAGSSVSGAGDVNGDGLPDLLVAAPGAPGGFGEGRGEIYVVFGTDPLPPATTYTARSIAGNSPRVTAGNLGDGNDTPTPAARAWIDFADGAAVSTETVQLFRNNSILSGLTDPANVAWEVTSTRTGWTSAELTFRYLDSEIVGLNEANLQLVKAPSASGPWTLLPTTVDQVKNTVSATVSGFSYFALVSTPSTVLGWEALGD